MLGLSPNPKTVFPYKTDTYPFYNQAGSNTAWGLGLIDITQTNAVDAYTNLPLDNSAKLRIYGDGWVEVLRTTFYVGDRARFFYVAGTCWGFLPKA